MTEPQEPRRALPRSMAGRYQLVSEIGAGGMGVVYKAMDVRLNRAVAIKTVHDRRLTMGASRLKEEALAVASLDHPYICKVYELVEDADETVIVMEFVEGKTLASMLRDGPLPLPLTLQIGREIAEGLADAHGRGLVHRDIKPSNVMLTSHDHVKLLDFGLAREDIASTPGADTHTSPARQTSYAGTPYYMAPEQAAGESVTARADLFSLGVVLYECLTGTLPFEGTTPFDYVRHVLADRPRALDRLAPGAPADLVQLVEQCLEKTPASRPPSASAIAEELRRLRDAMSMQGVSLRTAGEARARRRWRTTAWIGAAAAAAALVIWRWPVSPPVETTLRQVPVVTWASEESDSRISPDARWLSFLSTRSGAAQIFVQPIDGTDARPITLPAGTPMSHAWSPDGRSLAAILLQGDRVVLQVVPAFFGGAPQQTVAVTPPPPRVRVLRWIGRSVFLQTTGSTGVRLARVDLDGSGGPVDLTADLRIDGTPRSFDVHPDGRRVAYAAASGGQEDLWIANLDGTGAARLTSDASFDRVPLWRGDGATIVFQSNRGGQIDLWEIDPAARRPVPLTSSATEETPESSSRDGSMMSFEQRSEDAKLWVWQPSGRARQLTADALNDFAPVLSANGRLMAFQRAQPSPSQGFPLFDSTLFVAPYDAAGALSQPRRVADGFAASLSPDGAWLAYLQRSPTPARTTVLVKQLETDATVTVSTSAALPAFATSPLPVDWAGRLLAWHPSGRELYFVDQTDVTIIGRYAPGASAPGAPLVKAAAPTERIRDLQPVPDGRSLAYLQSSARGTAVMIVDLQTGQPREVATIDRRYTGVFARGWLEGGHELVLARILAVNDDRTYDMEIIAVSIAEGAVRTLIRVPDGFILTARLDGRGRSLFITRSEANVHNIYLVDLATRSVRKITNNTLPGVTFSGFEPAGPDGVIGSLDERKRDIWIMEARPVDAGR